MGEKLEIERKYLIEFPVSWSALADLLDNVVDIKRISQTYLNKGESGQSARVRKSVDGLSGDKDIVYTYNKKQKVDEATHKEFEEEISKSQYEKYLKDADKERKEVSKTRFVFNYKDQIFELDIFKGQLKGLAILEIELEDKNDKVTLPPFLQVIKEVTGDKKYSNYSLSKM